MRPAQETKEGLGDMNEDDVYYEIAGRIIKLRIATRQTCMCEADGDKPLLSLKTKTLYLLSKQERVSPQEIMQSLKILKPNMTTLANELETEELLEKSRGIIDRRSISYSITEKGKEYLNKRLAVLAKALVGIFDAREDYNYIISKIDEVLNFMAFITL